MHSPATRRIAPRDVHASIPPSHPPAFFFTKAFSLQCSSSGFASTATRKRHAHRLANQAETSIQNDTVEAVQNATPIIPKALDLIRELWLGNAVVSEPVSTLKFLLIGNIIGIFPQFRAARAVSDATNARFRAVFLQISYFE
jgi:hypothetical protein